MLEILILFMLIKITFNFSKVRIFCGSSSKLMYKRWNYGWWWFVVTCRLDLKIWPNIITAELVLLQTTNTVSKITTMEEHQTNYYSINTISIAELQHRNFFICCKIPREQNLQHSVNDTVALTHILFCYKCELHVNNRKICMVKLTCFSIRNLKWEKKYVMHEYYWN